MSQYQYDKSANLQTLESEIRDSSIVVSLEHLTSLGSQITITFKAALSTEDEATLVSLVTDHINTPTPEVAQLVTLNQPKDSDDAILIRPKAAKSGWVYHLTAPEFKTSELNSLHHKDILGADLGYCDVKYYDGNDVELTTQGSCDTDCVKTVFSFEPAWDYEIIGGTIKTYNDITVDMRVWVVAVPDIPAAYGGSKVMVQGVNLKFIDPNNGIVADGRASKFMAHSGTLHTNKLNVIVKHPAGVKEEIMIAFELYRS